MANQPNHPTQDKTKGGCLGSAITAVLILVVVAWFVPFSLPFGPKTGDKAVRFCGDHGGFAAGTATLVDIAQHEAIFACRDGTVRWVEW